MDIFLTEIANNSASLMFPSLPEKLTTKGSTNYQSYDIISQGTVKVPQGTNVTEISWEGVFFGEKKRREALIRSFTDPKECKNTLERWRDNGTSLRLVVTETGINCDVTISSLSFTNVGAHGNIEYSITLSRIKDIKIYTTTELYIAPRIVKIFRPSPPPAPAGTAYTVVAGDTLWKIAQNKLGAGTRWQEIYNANTDTIESTAKAHGKSSSDHGHWIWAGEVLTIPA